MNYREMSQSNDREDILFENFDRTPNNSYTDHDLSMFDELFKVTVGSEIERIMNIQHSYHAIGNQIVTNKSMKDFLEKLVTASCPRILKFDYTQQQLYLLHMVSVLFVRFNESTLNMSNDDFMNKVYFPNIANICAKYLVLGRRLIHRLAKTVYDEIKQKSGEVVDFYIEFHGIDPSLVRNDIVYLFLINIIPHFDPLQLIDMEEFYLSIFRRMFFFYLKSRTSNITDHELDPSIIQDEFMSFPSERYRIYEEGIYLAQIQLLCSDSSTLHRISQHFDQIKATVLPNELQRLFVFAVNKGQYLVNNDKILMMRTHNELSKMKEFRAKLPQIYRLLRSIHVISESSTFLPNDIEVIRSIIYNVLMNKFKHILSEGEVIPIIRKVSENLVRSLAIGEFIDMVTLTPIDISGHKFAKQLGDFLEMVLSEVNTGRFEYGTI